jgi:hypothetical protein
MSRRRNLPVLAPPPQEVLPVTPRKASRFTLDVYYHAIFFRDFVHHRSQDSRLAA